MVLAEVPQIGRRTSGLRKRHAPSAVRETEHNRDGHSNKKRKLEHPAIPPPRFWDHLSVIPLTRRALRESQRRISQSTDGQQIRNCYVCAPSHRTDANHFVQQLSPDCLGLVKRSARQGGPDLRDIRGVSSGRVRVHPVANHKAVSDSCADPRRDELKSTKFTAPKERLTISNKERFGLAIEKQCNAEHDAEHDEH